MCIGDGQRIFQNLFNGTPNIYDLVPSGEKLVGQFGKMMRHPRFGRRVRLINVNSRHRTTQGLDSSTVILGRTTNSVVEDKDARRPRTSLESAMVCRAEDDDSRIFQ